jgi:hypothetical protein
MSQAAVYTMLSTDATLMSHGITASSVYGSNSVDSPDERPFMILRWSEVEGEKDYGNVKRRSLTVWVHDSGQDYARINTILKRVQVLLSGAVHITGADGDTLTQADWRGDSTDFIDDGFKTITRSSSYTVGVRSS